MSVTAFALPNIERRTPVTVTADAPVLNVFKPVAETSLTDALGNPIDCIVVSYKIVLNRRHLDKPGLSCIVDERSIAAPAERVVVLELRRTEEESSLLKILKNRNIRILDKETCKRSFLCHITLAVNELNKRKIIVSADSRVVLTECRSNVNDTCTV